MAKEDGTAIEPEQRLARTFAKANGLLKVPIDIEAVFAQYATIELDDIPGSVDAILIRKDGDRPLLLVSSKFTSARTRYRFTLAHELGHMIIPWQVGTMFCHASATYHASDFLLQKIEAEANRFASEILVPHAWASVTMANDSTTLAERVACVADTAKVSLEAGVLAASRACDPDKMFILVDAAGTVAMASESPGSSFADVPSSGDRIAESTIYAIWGKLSELSRIVVGSRTIYAIDCSASSTAVTQPLAQASTAILAELLAEVEPDIQRKAKLSQTVNGVIGIANDMVAGVKDPAQIALKLRQRFINRPKLKAVVEHDLFTSFIDTKAHELAKKR